MNIHYVPEHVEVAHANHKRHNMHVRLYGRKLAKRQCVCESFFS